MVESQLSDEEADRILERLDGLHEQIKEIKTQTRQMRQISRLTQPEAYEEALATVADETGRIRVVCPRCDEVNLAEPGGEEFVECWQCRKTFPRERSSK